MVFPFKSFGEVIVLADLEDVRVDRSQGRQDQDVGAGGVRPDDLGAGDVRDLDLAGLERGSRDRAAAQSVEGDLQAVLGEDPLVTRVEQRQVGATLGVRDGELDHRAAVRRGGSGRAAGGAVRAGGHGQPPAERVPGLSEAA